MDMHESANNLAVAYLDGHNSTSFDDLPIELVLDILSWLPVKTILLTACVCKMWYSIIKTPAFISAQLSRSISNPYNKYILLAPLRGPPGGDHNFYLYFIDNLLSLQAEIKIPFDTMSETVFIVGSCNGLVCLTDAWFGSRGCDVYLTNPFIQKFKKLSAKDSCYADEMNVGDIAIGFGYSDVENDYKVVRNIYSSSQNWSKAEVYSLRSGKWKVINDSVYGIPIGTSPCFVDGCLYWLPFAEWLAYDSTYIPEDQRDLLVFDLTDEVFRTIEMPAKFIELCPGRVTNISQLNGSLALSVIGPNLANPTGNILCIFMMEKENDNSGQVHWKELYLETIKDELSVSYYRMRIGGSEKLEFEVWEGSSEPLNAFYQTYEEAELDGLMAITRICKLGALNLNNMNAAWALILDFLGCFFHTSFIGSLVSLSD